MLKHAIAGIAALSCVSGFALAGELPASSAPQASPVQLAQGVMRDYCLTCKGEKPANDRYTCWNARGLELGVRLRGDVLCLQKFGNPIYMIGEGKCSTKSYCKTIND